MIKNTTIFQTKTWLKNQRTLARISSKRNRRPTHIHTHTHTHTIHLEDANATSRPWENSRSRAGARTRFRLTTATMNVTKRLVVLGGSDEWTECAGWLGWLAGWLRGWSRRERSLCSLLGRCKWPYASVVFVLGSNNNRSRVYMMCWGV